MKRFLPLILALAMLLSLVACGDTVSSVSDENSDFVSEIQSEDVSEKDESTEQVSSEVDEGPENLALNKRVYFSSESLSMNMSASQAVDGDEDTVWASNTLSAKLDEWIMIDLGANYSINEISIDWGRSNAIEYTVSVSRGGLEFNQIYSTDDGAGSLEVIHVEGEIARYVRINCNKIDPALASYIGVSIKEILVNGDETDDQGLGAETKAMTPTIIVLPEQPDVYVMGRNYKYNELIWAGATFEYKCTGSVAGVMLSGSGGNENIRFEASIDGGPFTLYSLEKGTSAEFIFADNLDPNKEHTVCIMKTGDVWEPALTIKGAIVSEGADIVKNHTREYDLKIEFVGDSITSGGGVNGYAKSYVFLTADALNANFHAVSRSGQGLYKHANFGTPGPLKSLYAGIAAETGDYQYGYDADLVVLNIGTNDGANVRTTENETDKDAYRKTFKDMYLEMLEIIHEKNPNAMILCTGGMMGDIGQVKPEIKEAVELFIAKYPDAKIHLEYVSAAKDAGKDTGWHPGVEGHAKSSEELISIIKKIMNID